MKFGWTLSLLGAWALLMATMRCPWPTRLIYLHGGISLLVVGIAYLRERADVWRKEPDGRIPAHAVAALWPAHLLNQISFRLMRWLTDSAMMDEVTPRLFLGRRLVGDEAAFAGRLGFEAVLDLTSEFTETPSLRAVAHYRCLPVLDHAAPTQEQLDEAVAFIRAHRPDGPVFVHCAAGHGRSATVVAAYLLAERFTSDVASTIERLKAARPGVHLSEAQLDSLREFVEHHDLFPVEAD